jgi:uncharacterized protein (UPF0332 family)
MKPQADITTIKEMLAKSHKKIKTALTNFEHEQYDDSVSRSYYAVFHAISATLLSKGLHFSSHAQTIGDFNKEFVKTGKIPILTKTIEKLFSERQIGDYDFQTYLDVDTAKEDLEEAEKIIDACEEYLAKSYNVSKDYWRKQNA